MPVRVTRIALGLSLGLVGFGCTHDPTIERDAGGPEDDASLDDVSDAGPGSSQYVDADASTRTAADASMRAPDGAPAGPSDASTPQEPVDAALPAAAPACDVARCPVPDRPFPDLWNEGPRRTRACCHAGERLGDDTGAERCGLMMPSWNEWWCELVVEGELDDGCLDTVVDGELFEGCRRPDGRCGHRTEGWGCHESFRYDWEWMLEESYPDLPNPFDCAGDGQPCTRTVECCAATNLGQVCEQPEDGGVGTCFLP